MDDLPERLGDDPAPECEEARGGLGGDALTGAIAGLDRAVERDVHADPASIRQSLIDVQALAEQRVILKSNPVPLVPHLPL